MADCFYLKNGQKFGSMSDVIEAFFKDNKQLKNASIFSSDEIQESTYKAIIKISDINTFEKAKKEIIVDGLKQEIEIPIVTDFIVKENTLFEKLGIKTKSGRLNPEYIEDNRIDAYLLNNFNKVESMNSLPDDTTYSKDRFERLRNDPRFEKYSDVQIIALQSEIENTIEFENKVMGFGSLIHKLISEKINKNSYNSTLMAFLTDPKNAEIVGDFSKEEWVSKINYIVDSIYDSVVKIGIPISEIFLTSEIVRGKLDLIAVDKSGNAHIFELKVSKNPYENWDTAKLNTLDWQLALYKQLLGQHINIDQTMLYTIPIRFGYLGDPNVIYVEDFKNRSLTKRLRPEGEVTVYANKILPRKIITTYDPQREENIKSKLNQLFKGEDYEIKTDIINIDKDKILELAESRFIRDGIWKYWPEVEIAGEQKFYIIGKDKEDFEKNLIAYLDRANTLTNNNTLLLKDALNSSITTKSAIKVNKSDEYNLLLNKLFKNYISDDWEVVNNVPEATALGVILLRNKTNNDISMVSMTVNQPYATSKVDGLSYGDLEIMKTFLLINEMKSELFPGGYGRVGQIIVFNPNTTKDVYIKNVYSKFESFKQLMYSKGLGQDLKLEEFNISPIENIALYELDSLHRSYNGVDKKAVSEIFESIANKNLADIELDELLDIQQEFFRRFPEYKKKTFSAELNFEDSKEILLAQLQVAIVSKGGFETANDFQNLSTYSFGFADFGHLITSLFSENKKEYSKAGKKIQGLLGGLVWSPPDWVMSKDLKNINKLMSKANQHIGEWTIAESAKIHQHTKKYYKDINYTSFERNIIGETQTKHENLWLHDNDKVSDLFRTKDPYTVDEKNILNDAEREYLQEMLLIINQWKLELTEKEVSKLNPKDIKSLRSNEKIAEAIDNGSYFEMPLIRREEVSRHKHLLGKDSVKNKVTPYWNDLNDFLDTRELSKEDLELVKDQTLGFYEMFDVYGHQSKDFKAKAINKYKVDYFEFNLDTIANRVSFSKIRKKIYDRQLPIINSYVWWIKLMGGKENEAISKQLEYISDQMKLSVFDDPIIDEEFGDVAKVTSAIKKVSTIGMLAFKPASLVKELTIGLFKSISLASTKIYGKNEFNIEDITKAYTKLTTIDKKFSEEFNLIDNLNLFYRFANMDINTMSKKVQTDRRGVMKGLGRYMFAFNTIPDYYNRLAILLAKMIHDGSYEAHTLENGQLVYDPTKDKRFEYYFKNREKYKNGDLYIPASNDKEYNTQRQKYLLLISQLNAEYSGTKKFTEESYANKAYSEIERSSLKSFSDMVYGYYDKDAQAPSNNTWWGIIYLQFMQFWPGKMKMWFAKPTDESPMGHMQQAFVEDESGNKKLLWKKSIVDSNGDFILDEQGQIKFQIVEEDTGDPVYEWKGSPYEGLMYSVLGTIKDVLTLDFSSIKSNEDRNRRVMFALTDGILMFLMFSIIKALIDAFIDENGEEGLTGDTLRMSKSINNKILNEYNIYNSTLGAISSEPVFLSWSKKLAKDSWDTISGDKEFMTTLSKNFGFAEVLKWTTPNE